MHKTDFIGPVNIVRKGFGKTVIVLNPHDRISWLRDYASYYRDIPRDILAKCQLPGSIPYRRKSGDYEPCSLDEKRIARVSPM